MLTCFNKNLKILAEQFKLMNNILFLPIRSIGSVMKCFNK